MEAIAHGWNTLRCGNQSILTDISFLLTALFLIDNRKVPIMLAQNSLRRDGHEKIGSSGYAGNVPGFCERASLGRCAAERESSVPGAP